jgi:N-terminal domain of anti-restriction factor ArdC
MRSNNQLLIPLSCPDATLVAGFKAWLSLGYCVRKGETAIRIIAPTPVKPGETTTSMTTLPGTPGRWCYSRPLGVRPHLNASCEPAVWTLQTASQ